MVSIPALLMLLENLKKISVTNLKPKRLFCYLKNLNDLSVTNVKLKGCMNTFFILFIIYHYMFNPITKCIF
jgi:hypothetical protein